MVSANSPIGSARRFNSRPPLPLNRRSSPRRLSRFTYTGPVGVSTPSSSIPGATDVLGATQTGYWFGFAEGYTGGSFGEYLTLENPDPTNTAYVGITYLPAGGSAPTVEVVKIPPHSRYTINTNKVMVGQSFSMIVESGLQSWQSAPNVFRVQQHPDWRQRCRRLSAYLEIPEYVTRYGLNETLFAECLSFLLQICHVRLANCAWVSQLGTLVPAATS